MFATSPLQFRNGNRMIRLMFSLPKPIAIVFVILLALLTIVLLVTATISVRAATEANATQPNAPRKADAIIDFSTGANQSTDGICGVVDIRNLDAQRDYHFYARSTSSSTCSFRADGLTFKYPPNYGATQAGNGTLFSFIRFGSDVIVTWAPGY